jgi:hypothetical protein
MSLEANMQRWDFPSTQDSFDFTATESYEYTGDGGFTGDIDDSEAAFVRFRDAANKQIQELNTISENINKAGVQYQDEPPTTGQFDLMV